MIENLNPYYSDAYKQRLIGTPFYQRLSEDFDILSFDKFFTAPEDQQATPRQFFGDKKLLRKQTKFSLVPFYYIDYLLEKKPTTILDLGCGWNVFKNYIPNITGIGPESDHQYKFADITDCIDEEFVVNHKDSIESAIAINSLHFHPITEFKNIVTNFVSMLKSGSRGFITFNWALMLNFTPQYVHGQIWDYNSYIRQALSEVDCKFIVVDIDLSRLDDPMDGNVRLVLESN
jgi:hypothetical protein